MRPHGALTTPLALGLHGHACLLYEDDARFHRLALDVVVDGLRLGLRVVCAAGSAYDRLETTLRGALHVDDLVDEGRLELTRLEAGASPDPEGQLEQFEAATHQALADGFAGLRSFGEATDLVVATPDRRAQLCWECVAEDLMTDVPMSGLCCYDRRRLPAELVGDLAAVHPVVGGLDDPDDGGVPFRLFAEHGRLVLEGSVDAFGADRLARLLPLAAAARPGAVLDLGRLRFVDHRGVLALQRHRGDLEVRHAPYAVARLCDLLGVELR